MIRIATIDDAPRIAEIVVAAWRIAYRGIVPADHLQGLDLKRREKLWKSLCQDSNGRVFVATENDRIVGFCHISATRDPDMKNVAEITSIYLDPGHWRKGHGRELSTMALSFATRQGFNWATLWVLTENASGRRFYEAMGFQPDGATKQEPRLGFILNEMRYRIPLRDPMGIATAYWAGHLGCSPEELFAEPFRMLPHADELADYWGVFAVSREYSVVVSAPPDAIEGVRALLSLRRGNSLEALAAALDSVAAKVIGPAFIGYAKDVPSPEHPARSLTAEDANSLLGLEQACDATEWEHGGSSLDATCSGVFIDDRLVALAGYEIWGNTIAHIAIVTHPEFRGRGFGRSAVAHLAHRAIAAGLLPQYRTLISNRPSMGLGVSLGFQPFATSLAIRLKPEQDVEFARQVGP